MFRFSPPRGTLAVALGLMTFALVLGVLALALAREGDASFTRVAAQLKLAVLANIAVSVSLWYGQRLGQRGEDAFAPTRGFVALYLVWFAVGSMDFVPRDPRTPLWDPIPLTLWVYVIAGLIAYLVGCSLVSRYKPRAQWVDPARWRTAVDAWDRGRVQLVGLGLLLLIAGPYMAIALRGGVPLLNDNIAQIRTEAQARGVMLQLFLAAVLAYVPLALLYAWSRSGLSKRVQHFVYLSVGITFLLALSLGNRGQVLEPALLAVLTFHYCKRRLALRDLAWMSVGALLFLSTFGIYRDYRQFGIAHFRTYAAWGFPIWSLPVTYIYTYVRDPVMTFYRLTRIVPTTEPFMLGRIHLQPFVTLLPGHHESPDLIFKRILGSEFVGFGQPATLIGNLYVDFGIVAIVAGLYLFGVLSGFVQSRLHRRPSPYLVLLHIWIVHQALLSLFGSLFPFIMTLIVPVVLFFLVALLGTGSELAKSGETEEQSR